MDNLFENQDEYNDIFIENGTIKIDWKWLFEHQVYLDKIELIFNKYLEQWLLTKKSHPLEKRTKLYEFIICIEKLDNICKAAGSKYQLWFNSYLIKDNYLEKRKSELESMDSNMDNLILKYEKRIELENLKPIYKSKIINILTHTPNILQTDIYKLFDPELKEYISSLLYEMDKENSLQRIKTGHTYKLSINTHCK